MPSKSDADKVLKRFDDKIFVFNCKEEIDLVYNLIIHSAGFDVDIAKAIAKSLPFFLVFRNIKPATKKRIGTA